MSAWSEHVHEFWDGVHKRGTSVHLGNTVAEDYTAYFSKAGPFAEDLEKALSVLDIGPGFGRFLESVPNKVRFAIDVSKNGRERVEAMGVKAWAPGDLGAGACIADVVTCLSVVQHCDEAAFELILSDAARVLNPYGPGRGRFYLNGVHGGHHTPSPEGLLSGGRFSYSPARARELAGKHGFVVAGEHVYKAGALEVWVLCLGKS